ncbi:MAG: 16S rRNA (cytidine(1402)-2'-O)-methyltransferase [Omnitrophica bacterium RIFCSPHIGHO2_02_FULL_63_14]|nr:MAG: 16S rRNA (cytidine(1402)-2'-O)-methyltransferase [Omnitrophica bacterium RIFCSPHIGHO2_02_FULL_63_14]
MEHPPGVLHLVATPIGNLKDITFRAIEVLNKADVIACEDTRRSKILLTHFGIDRPLVSYADFSEKKKAPALVEKLLSGADIALISDAGMPGIADPGYRLVTAAIREGIRVECVPGASAILTALAVSGLPTDRFTFEGFLPVKTGARKNKLASLKGEERTVIVYESPHRILKSLSAIQEVYGDIHLVVARELTKKFEEVTRGRVSEIIEKFSSRKPLGEFVILFNLTARHCEAPQVPKQSRHSQ